MNWLVSSGEVGSWFCSSVVRIVRNVLYSDWTDAETALEVLLDEDALLAEFESSLNYWSGATDVAHDGLP